MKNMSEHFVPIDNIYNECIVQDFLKNRAIWLNDEVNEISVTKVIYDLNKIKRTDDISNIPIKDRQPITIICNSPGEYVIKVSFCVVLLNLW